MRKKGAWGKIIDINLKQLCIYLDLFLCCEMFMVIITSHYVNEYLGEHSFATGILEDVSIKAVSNGYAVEIGVNGKKYKIPKINNTLGLLPYDFDVKGNNARDAIRTLSAYLEREIGNQVHIEYIREDQILGLTIGGTEYLNADAVLEDHIAYQRLGRNISAAAFVITLIPFIIILFRVLHAKQ